MAKHTRHIGDQALPAARTASSQKWRHVAIATEGVVALLHAAANAHAAVEGMSNVDHVVWVGAFEVKSPVDAELGGWRGMGG